MREVIEKVIGQIEEAQKQQCNGCKSPCGAPLECFSLFVAYLADRYDSNAGVPVNEARAITQLCGGCYPGCDVRPQCFDGFLHRLVDMQKGKI